MFFVFFLVACICCNHEKKMNLFVVKTKRNTVVDVKSCAYISLASEADECECVLFFL